MICLGMVTGMAKGRIVRSAHRAAKPSLRVIFAVLLSSQEPRQVQILSPVKGHFDLPWRHEIRRHVEPTISESGEIAMPCAYPIDRIQDGFTIVSLA
jgi:hypothetical protein